MVNEKMRSRLSRLSLAALGSALAVFVVGIAPATVASGAQLEAMRPAMNTLCLQPIEVNDSLRVLKSGDSAIFSWDDIPAGSSYTVYRGSTVTGRPWPYDHACLQVHVGAPGFPDDVVPRPGTGFYYYVSSVDVCGAESVLGRDSDGAPVPNINSCPPPDSDADGVADVLDDCPSHYEDDQIDTSSGQQ